MKILKNPKTRAYLEFKSFILSGKFYWFYEEHIYSRDVTWDKDLKPLVPKNKLRASDYVDVPFFSHMFLKRPMDDQKYPTVNSSHLGMVLKVVDEILQYNKIKVNCFYRINGNLTLPMKGHNKTIPHLDHHFNHKIVFIYLTNAGGETVCVDNNLKKQEGFEAPEDGVMSLEGSNQLHYHCLAEKKRRIVVMATYI
jgi:hypothetical protein